MLAQENHTLLSVTVDKLVPVHSQCTEMEVQNTTLPHALYQVPSHFELDAVNSRGEM